MWWIPSQAQSVGVPSTAYQRGRTSRSRSGRWIEIACEDALCSTSGATTQTSPELLHRGGERPEALGLVAVVVRDQDAGPLAHEVAHANPAGSPPISAQPK